MKVFFQKPHNTKQKKTSKSKITRNTTQKKNTSITLINVYTRNITARGATITISFHSTAIKLIVVAIASAVPLVPTEILSIVTPSPSNKTQLQLPSPLAATLIQI